MTLVKINLDPSPRDLRWFGGLLFLFFGVIGAIVLWRSQSLTASIVLWSFGASLSAAYYAVRAIRRPLYVGWMYAFFPIGWMVSHTMMAITYYLIFAPLGLGMRLLGRDSLERRLDRTRSSYWTEHRPGSDPARYFRQF